MSCLLFWTDFLSPLYFSLKIFLFKGRPKLSQTLSGIIYSIATGDGLPEELIHDCSLLSKSSPSVRARLLLEKARSIYTMDQLYEYAVEASSADSAVRGENDAYSAPSSAISGDEENGLRNRRRSSHVAFQKKSSTRSLRHIIEDDNLETVSHADETDPSDDQHVQIMGRRFSRSASRKSIVQAEKKDDNMPTVKRQLSRRFSLGRNLDSTRSFGSGSMREFGTSSKSLFSQADDLMEHVTYQGLCKIMQELLGDAYEFIEEELRSNFDLMSVSGELDRECFVDLMELMIEDRSSSHQRSEVKTFLEKKSGAMNIFDSSHGDNQDDFEVRALLKEGPKCYTVADPSQ